MKKLLMFVIFISILMNIFAEKRMIIHHKPSKVFNVELDFIDINGYTGYASFIESLQKGRRVFLEVLLPKTAIIEGEYQLVIYEDNICIGIYTVINDDYVYNERKDYFQKVPNVLNNLRAILYIEYLRKQNENVPHKTADSDYSK